MFGNHVLARLVRFSFTFLMAFVWTGGLAAVAQPAGNEPPSNDAIIALLRQFVQVAAEELRAPGADPSDIPAKAAELGFDVEATFAFVRDQIAYEPYRGVLRGAEGALASGAGNAYDKALLLRDLLQSGGHQAMLVKGTLPVEQAETLVDAYLAGEGNRALIEFANRNADDGMPANLAERLGLAKAQIEQFLAQRRAESEAFLAATRETTDTEAAFLRDQLKAAGIEMGRSFDEWRAELIDRAGEHVWVQLTTPDGQTVALDPMFADAQPGQRFGTDGDVANVDEDRHVVNFQLVYATNDGEEDTVLVEVPLPADKVLTAPATFSIQPTDSVPPMSDMMEMEPADLIKLWTGFKSYQGVVTLGGERFASRAFDLKGNVMDVAADGRIRGASEVGGAVGGLFGGAFGGEDVEPASKTGTFEQLSVRLTFQAPGSEPQAQQRVLLTKEQVSGNHFMSPILEWRMLVQPQPVSMKQYSYGSLQHTVQTLEPLLPMLDRPVDDRMLDQLSGVRPSPYPQPLIELTILRQVEMARQAQASPKVIPLWDQAQMTIAERRFCAHLDGSGSCSMFGIDIVNNAMSFVPRDAAAATEAAQVALRQGVFDTAAEAALAETAVAGSKPRAVTSAIESASAARSAGASLAVIAPRDTDAMSTTTLSDTDRAWIEQYEPESRRIVAISGAAGQLDSVWWSLDPETGSILGRRDGGRGQTNAEYTVQLMTGVICGIFTIWNYKLDEANRGGKSNENQKQGGVVALMGCAVGASFGIAGVGMAFVPASALTLINAVIGGLFTMWGGSIGRRP